MGEQEERKGNRSRQNVAHDDDEIAQFSKRNGVTLKEARQLVAALRRLSTKPTKPDEIDQ